MVVGTTCQHLVVSTERRRTALAAFAIALPFVLTASGGAVAGSAASPAARIVFVNVGQGDGVVMKVGSKVIVSDAGEFDVENMNEALLSLDATQIDVAILSHPHQDHVKNFVALIDEYGWNVKLAVLSRSAYWRGTDTNRAIMDRLAANGVPLRFVTAGQDFDWGGGDWRILNPPKGKYAGKDDAANASVAYLLTVKDVRALFTGDIEPDVAGDVAQELVDDGLDQGVDVFLATHHGSKYGSVIDLLNVIHPRWVVLSTGPNGFHHPAASTIQRLEDTGASIWCTNANGSVTARVSASGLLTWRASKQVAPWWSAEAKKETGICVDQ